MEHEELVEKAKEAINRVFSDQSVSKDITRSSLDELAGEIDTYLDTLRE